MMVRYIGQRDTVALDRSKIYAVLSIEKGWYRIMTELDEDYLFPPDVFEIEDEKEEWLWKTAVIAGRQLRTTYRWT